MLTRIIRERHGLGQSHGLSGWKPALLRCKGEPCFGRWVGMAMREGVGPWIRKKEKGLQRFGVNHKM